MGMQPDLEQVVQLPSLLSSLATRNVYTASRLTGLLPMFGQLVVGISVICLAFDPMPRSGVSWARVLLLPLLGRIAFRCPRMYGRDLLLQFPIDELVSCECRCLREFIRDDSRFEHLTTATYMRHFSASVV